VLVVLQDTLVLQKEPTPQSESLLQNWRQVFTGCATVEQVVNSKHSEPDAQAVVSTQGSPGLP
jgi:hypothetical protein